LKLPQAVKVGHPGRANNAVPAGRAAVLREACAARGDRPISSLVEAGRGGLPQDLEATLPALYIAGRDINPNPMPGAGTTEADGAAVQTTAHLTMRCG
jgi:hypothetical protein